MPGDRPRFLILRGGAIGDFLVTLPVLQALRERWPGAWLELLALPQCAELLSVASAYVGNDSGITHLAAAVGCPTVALFGPSNPALWSPRGPHVRTLPAPGGDLTRLPVAPVLDALTTLLARPATPPRASPSVNVILDGRLK